MRARVRLQARYLYTPGFSRDSAASTLDRITTPVINSIMVLESSSVMAFIKVFWLRRCGTILTILTMPCEPCPSFSPRPHLPAREHLRSAPPPLCCQAFRKIMSYLKSIHNAQAKAKTGPVTEFQGPLDLLMVSPASGRAVVPLLPQAADVQGRRVLRGQDVHQEVQAQRRSGVVVHVRQEGPCWHAVRCRQPARTRRDCSPCPHPATLAPQR